jgi:hypothetical protein
VIGWGTDCALWLHFINIKKVKGRGHTVSKSPELDLSRAFCHLCYFHRIIWIIVRKLLVITAYVFPICYESRERGINVAVLWTSPILVKTKETTNQTRREKSTCWSSRQAGAQCEAWDPLLGAAWGDNQMKCVYHDTTDKWALGHCGFQLRTSQEEIHISLLSLSLFPLLCCFLMILEVPDSQEWEFSYFYVHVNFLKDLERQDSRPQTQSVWVEISTALWKVWPWKSTNYRPCQLIWEVWSGSWRTGLVVKSMACHCGGPTPASEHSCLALPTACSSRTSDTSGLHGHMHSHTHSHIQISDHN